MEEHRSAQTLYPCACIVFLLVRTDAGFWCPFFGVSGVTVDAGTRPGVCAEGGLAKAVRD